MARFLLADDGIEFDGKTPEQKPLGGVESSIVAMTEELVRRGHEVFVRNNCKAPLDHKGVQWRPISSENPTDWPRDIDLYIANRGDKLIALMPTAKRSVFWIHNPAQYLMKWRYLWKLWKHKPAIIFIGDYHATTYPDWAPGGERIVIPYGLPDAFCQADERPVAPPPRAVFTSNPLRSLDWLLKVWSEKIEPRVPGAELHLFTGSATYGHVGDAKATAMGAVLSQAESLAGQGVVLRGPVAKQQLVTELSEARVMLYRGDLNETFCLALGEAQAMGVPCVVEDKGSVPERIVEGASGFVTDGDAAFAEAAVKLLTQDALWRKQHHLALKTQRNWRWPEAAAAFENLIP